MATQKVGRFRASASLGGLIFLAAAAAAGVFGYLQKPEWPPGEDFVLGTASEGGAYARIGGSLAAFLDEDFGDQVAVDAVNTRGSIDNVNQLANGDLQFALVQSDILEHRDQVNTLAVMYEERMHLIVRDAAFDTPPESIEDLDGKRVAIGPVGSGTRNATTRVLAHFGVTIIDAVESLGLDSTSNARAALSSGSIDAMFVLSGVPDRTVQSILNEGGNSLVPVFSQDIIDRNVRGFHTHERGYVTSRIFDGVYRGFEIEDPIYTLSVNALLVARHDISERAAHEVLRVLFSRRFDMEEAHPLARDIRQADNAFADQPFPPHPGALKYFSGFPPSNELSLRRYGAWTAAALSALLGLVILSSEAARLGRLRKAAGVGRETKAHGEHDIFISHPSRSPKAKATVEALARTLEEAGIRCWYAPRNIRAGELWADAIPDAIEGARHGFVLIHDEAAGESEHVPRELAIANDAGKRVFFYRVDASQPTASILYYVKKLHWLDAFEGPAEQYQGWIIAAVSRMRAGDDDDGGVPAPEDARTAPQPAAG